MLFSAGQWVWSRWHGYTCCEWAIKTRLFVPLKINLPFLPIFALCFPARYSDLSSSSLFSALFRLLGNHPTVCPGLTEWTGIGMCCNVFTLALRLNFPCKSVVSGWLRFLSSFPFFLFLSFGDSERAVGAAVLRKKKLWVKSRKGKAEVPGLIESWYFCLWITLCCFRLDSECEAGGMDTPVVVKQERIHNLFTNHSKTFYTINMISSRLLPIL